MPVVDAMVVYECLYSDKHYLMIINNALYVKDNPDNYIAPFILQEAGITVDTTAKLHCTDPTVNDHSMYFKDEGLRVHFNITGVVSYFLTRKSSNEEINTLPVLYPTPDLPAWDPYDVKHEHMEDVMLDYKGNIVFEKERSLLLDLENDKTIDIDLEDVDFDIKVSAVFQNICEKMEFALGENVIPEPDPMLYDNTIALVNPIYDPIQLANSLQDRLSFEKFGISLGTHDPETDCILGAAHHDKPKGITPERLAQVF